jgi:hypothetical protein
VAHQDGDDDADDYDCHDDPNPHGHAWFVFFSLTGGGV